MKSLLLLVALIIISANTYARKPAVEDFVGVEPESYKVTPQGTEVLFNFQQNVQAIETPATETQSPWLGLGVITMFIALPVFMWWGLTRNTPKPQQVVATATQPESSSENVHQLEDYRKPEEEKKAS